MEIDKLNIFMGVVSHLCICVYPNDLEVTKQCVSSAVPLHLSFLLVLSITLCWSCSFLLFAIQTVNTLMSLLFLYGTFVRDISVLPISANATEYKPKKFLWYWPYLFIYILLGKGKSILSSVYCVVCKYGLPHSQHNLKDDSHEMSLTLPHVATWKFAPGKGLLLTYTILVVNWDVYVSKTVVDVEV